MAQPQESVAAQLDVHQDMLVSFANSGTEANEAALKLARKATGRLDFLAFDHSFHGRSAGSLTVTGNEGIKEGFLPLVPGARFAKYNDFAAIDEIKPDVDNDPRAAYFDQVHNGVYIRMAIILALLGIPDPLTGKKVLESI